MSHDNTLIYFADLTHTGPVVSSNFYPLAVGMVASYLLKRFSDKIEIELFKYPSDLSLALSNRMPQIIGFSNYPWNLNLSYEYAMRIKKQSPSTVTVFGGPNYGSFDAQDIHDFWKRYNLCDFYVVKEGEQAMAELLEVLFSSDFDLKPIKKSKTKIHNCHYLSDGEIIEGELLPRIDANEIPSPYLSGLMDKFFDTLLVPIVSTTRGCPFSCKFCQEGDSYYRTIRAKTNCYEELEYIAQNVKGSHDLFVTDSNFGMYKQDLQTSRDILQLNRKYGWPKRVELTWGKSRPERVVETASILKGLTAPVGSVQTTDPDVLKNVSRRNLPIEVLRSIASSNSEEHDSITEIILGLPGDTFEKHKRTIKDAVEVGFTFLSVYSLSLLKGSVLNSVDSRERYQMKTKYRILPRSFGKYELFGEIFPSVEDGEEICMETDTMSFASYIQCRELDLTIEIIHNGGIFLELAGLCQWLEMPWFDFIMNFYDKKCLLNGKLTELYDYFQDGATKDLWDTTEKLQEDVKDNIDHFLLDELGTNELVACKSIVVVRLLSLFHEILYGEILKVLAAKGRLNGLTELYIRELKEYSLLRKKNLFDYEKQFTNRFSFDFKQIAEKNFSVDPQDYVFPTPIQYTFYHDEKQKELIARFIEEYGTSISGMGRMTRMRSHFRTLFRRVVCTETRNTG